MEFHGFKEGRLEEFLGEVVGTVCICVVTLMQDIGITLTQDSIMLDFGLQNQSE